MGFMKNTASHRENNLSNQYAGKECNCVPGIYYCPLHSKPHLKSIKTTVILSYQENNKERNL
jgi:hypothetical protein